MNILHLVETERAQAEEAAIEAKEKEEQNQSASDVQTPGTQEKPDGNDTPKTPE
jgi:hypothetical protein